MYYIYKIKLKNGADIQLYLKDVDLKTINQYITDKEIKIYNKKIINFGEVAYLTVKELTDEKRLTRVNNEKEIIVKPDNFEKDE